MHTKDVFYYLFTEDAIARHTALCEKAIGLQQPQPMVDNSAVIAKLANRVLMVAKQESDNSEDPQFIVRVNRAADELQKSTYTLPFA